MSITTLLVRLFTKGQVITKYGIRPDYEHEFFEDCPVAFLSEGEPIFKESDVDEYMRHFRTPPYKHPSKRKGGVASPNTAIAAFAETLLATGKLWKEVAKETNEKFPPGPGKQKRTPESIRKLVERHRLSAG